jgi:hypothetical protein
VCGEEQHEEDANEEGNVDEAFKHHGRP